jgi:hypothetical protein
VLLGLVAAPRPATAEERAEALFNRGLADMLAGRHESGCPAIAESQALEPLPGTLFTLAECEAQRGRLATAVASYDAYLTLFSTLSPERQAKQHGREAIAAQQKALLDPQIPRLTVTLGPGAPSGTVVRRDHDELPLDQLSVALPLDPGEHVITTQRPGGPIVERRVVLGPGEKRTLVLEVAPVAEAPARAAARKSAVIAAPRAAILPPALRPSPERISAYVLGGLGAAGVIVGGVMGGLALGQKGAITMNCRSTGPDTADCNATGKAAADRGQAFGNASTIGLGAGLGALGVAAVLYLTAPAALPPSPRPSPSPRRPGAAGARRGVRWSLAATGPATAGLALGGDWQ